MKILNTSVQIHKNKILIVVECENEELFYCYGRFRKGYELKEEYEVYQSSQHHWMDVVDGIGVITTTSYSHIIQSPLETDGYIVPLKRITRGELVEMLT